jgi:hypothetical protein
VPDLQCGGILVQVDRLATTEYTHTTAWFFADADSDTHPSHVDFLMPGVYQLKLITGLNNGSCSHATTDMAKRLCLPMSGFIACIPDLRSEMQIYLLYDTVSDTTVMCRQIRTTDVRPCRCAGSI